jgi:hypothetical protein
MKYSTFRSLHFTAAVVLAWPLLQMPAKGQATANPQALPRLADGKPDITGVWAGPGFSFKPGAKYSSVPSITGFRGTDLPFRPGGEDLYNLKKNGEVMHDDPQLLCLPHGIPRVILSARAQQFVRTPKLLVILYEDDHANRVIPLDGRRHPQDLDETWMGNSVGKWDGDTLVVDTVGLKPWSIDARDHMHTEALHVIERYTMSDPDTMSVEITLDDPKIFTKPWSQTWGMHKHDDWSLLEDICEENNKDPNLIEYLKKSQ